MMDRLIVEVEEIMMMEVLWDGGGCQKSPRGERRLRDAHELCLPAGGKGESWGGPPVHPWSLTYE